MPHDGAPALVLLPAAGLDNGVWLLLEAEGLGGAELLLLLLVVVSPYDAAGAPPAVVVVALAAVAIVQNLPFNFQPFCTTVLVPRSSS